MFVHINSWNDARNNNETMIKRYVKQKIKHKMKRYSTRVSVRQVEEQHSETKRLVKRKKENRNNTPPYPSRIPDLVVTWHDSAVYQGYTVVWIFGIPMVFCNCRLLLVACCYHLICPFDESWGGEIDVRAIELRPFLPITHFATVDTSNRSVAVFFNMTRF